MRDAVVRAGTGSIGGRTFASIIVAGRHEIILFFLDDPNTVLHVVVTVVVRVRIEPSGVSGGETNERRRTAVRSGARVVVSVVCRCYNLK